MQLRALLALAVVLALAGCGGSGGGSGSAPAPSSGDRAVVKTSEGSFTIRLQPAVSPNAVESFEKLARKGFFDGTIFHRIVPGFVIQGGDPTGTGSGGPGYTTVDPPPANTRYTKGTVAMAKTQAEPPGTAGSQSVTIEPS
jgi:cyclophilin family peptidyl-prolyl cis-trans isomerase